MNNFKLIKKLQLFFIVVLSLSCVNVFGKPKTSFTWEYQQPINIFVSCVEDLGNGKLLAHFGYENPNETTFEVYYTRSVLCYVNDGLHQEYVINSFEPGIHDRVFSQKFDADGWAKWVVRLSFFHFKTALATSNSELCQGQLDIIPGYNPPIGGKEYDSKIGAELTALYEAYTFDPNVPDAPEDIFQLNGTEVLIEVVSYPEGYDAMIASLGNLGFEIQTADPDLNKATGWIDIGKLMALNEIDALHYARPVYPGVSNYIVPATGLTNSQGDFSMHSDFARLGYDIKGAGVKIGVLSNSFDTKGNAALDVTNGDLPGEGNINGYLTPVDVLKDFTPSQGSLSDEGRAMLQIIHDIAPGAELAFRTGYLGEQDMADGIRELAAAGCDIIVDDLSYITEPFFRDGIISQAIDDVVAQGVIFFSSAGNFGNSSYMDVFNPGTAPSSINGEAHDFSGSGDVLQGILLNEGSYTLVLQWDDGSDPSMSTTETDLDIFLSDDTGYSLLGFNRENIGGFPIEVVPFSVQGESVPANVIVSRASGDRSVTFKYMLFRGGTQFQMLEYGEGSSTIVGHPNAAGAIAVGAVRFDKNPIYNPAEYPVPVIMSFSSVGGTPVDGIIRAKPDFTAPNGINTTVDLGNGDWDDPIDPDTEFPNFFGTSAASPHAAGMAALIMEAKAKFDPDALVTPDFIRNLMKSTTIEKLNGGEDNYVSGSGFIQAHRALMTFANPSPYVENLILASGGDIPGEEITPFSFTVSGDFFTDETQVLFRGEPLNQGVVIVDESTIEVEHPGFIGNPEVQAFNPVISPSELDGGSSDPIFFSDPIKYQVTITANNYNKKYGEVLPEFIADITVEDLNGDMLSLEDAVNAGIMLEEEAVRLSGLSFDVSASANSDAGQYIIVPYLDPLLNLDDPQTEIDHAIAEKYILNYINGTLTIEKLSLKITPENVEMTYGQQLPDEGFDFIYEIEDPDLEIGDLDLILSGAEQEHTTALTNDIALVRGIALVNGIPMVRGIALVNGVPLIRGIALVNGIEVRVETEGDLSTVYVAGEPVSSGTPLIRGIALVNDLPFVNMTDIVRGIALVNGSEVTFDEGYMTELDGVPLPNLIPAVRGIALVNGTNNIRGIALVNGHEVIIENGVTTIDQVAVPTEGIVEVNGIPIVRGIALVNSGTISRGIALVNDVEVPIENGIPTVRGIALVNGIPLVRGIALVNNLRVDVDNGEVQEVYENGVLMNGFTISRGIALVNEVALVNGTDLSDGPYLVNGLALMNAAGDGGDVVNLENMNFMTSNTVLTNGSIPSVRGIALVNGVESLDGNALNIAAGTVQNDGSIIYENVTPTSRGIALVNGGAYIRGIALVNNLPVTSGTPIVNGSTEDDNSFEGTILVFDATQDIGEPAEDISFAPMSFITGTDAGQHWIVPGTYISNNFDISYGLGTLTIDPAVLSISADNKSKVFGEDDPELSYQSTGLLGQDAISGQLIREEGEDIGDYAILQGSVTAGDNYAILYHPGTLTINPASLTISISAENKVYDGNSTATVTLSDNRLSGSDLSISYSSAMFEDKHVGVQKEVTVSGLALTGADAGNYTANTEATTTANITPRDLVIAISADNKTYDGNTSATTYASIFSGLVDGDDVLVSSANGVFDDKHVANGKTVTADVSTSGADAGNYSANTMATTLADISPKQLIIGITAQDKEYDGNYLAATSAYISTGMVDGDILIVSSTNGLFADKNVGTWTVTADVYASGADAGNYTANNTATGTAEITQREVTVTPIIDFYCIREGDALPDFFFDYNGWIADDDGNDNYSVLRDTDGVAYDPNSDESAGTYTVTPISVNSNYYFTAETATLYVNPYGPGTRAIKPELNCVEKEGPGRYVANLEYKNDNDVDVYIPIGEDNSLTGGEIFSIVSDEGDHQPTLFKAGGGIFQVYFDGTELSWVVNSLDEDHKISSAANANSSSTKCKKTKSAFVSAAVEKEEPAADILLVYPNPVTQKVYLTMKDIEHYKMIILYDIAGKSHPITSIEKRHDHLEIDMAQLSSGYYFFKVVMEDSIKVVKLVKE